MPSDQLCSFTSCGKPVCCKGLCKAHYTQLGRGQELRPTLDALPRACRIEGCDRPIRVVRDQLCQSHYDRRRRGTLDGLGPRACVVCCAVFTPIRRANTQCCSDACSGKNARLKQKYGLDGAQLNAMLGAQNGQCAICAKDIATDTIHVDHDHACCPTPITCGECVRALLCASCNRGIGHFNDDPDLTQAATEYLRRFAAPTLTLLS